MHAALALAALLLLAYLGALVTMTLRQRRILYLPERDTGGPEEYGLARGSVFSLASEDGTALAGWHVTAAEAMPTILYFHGNAGHLGHRLAKFRHFTGAGFGLVAVSYRGYGGSEGRPTEKGVIADARSVTRYALRELGLDPARLIAYGESLGSGVAVRMAGEHRFGGLVLEAPYTSVVDRAAELYPWLPTRRLLRDRYESLSHLPKILCPFLILHGENDAVIPVAHGRRMFDAALGPKRSLFYPGIGHTDFDFAEITRELLAFAREHGLCAASSPPVTPFPSSVVTPSS